MFVIGYAKVRIGELGGDFLLVKFSTLWLFEDDSLLCIHFLIKDYPSKITLAR